MWPTCCVKEYPRQSDVRYGRVYLDAFAVVCPREDELCRQIQISITDGKSRKKKVKTMFPV
jgi:hypothetical protein